MGRQKRILVVEQSERIRPLLVELIADEGYHVAGAGSAEEALRLLSEETWDLLTLEPFLPGRQPTRPSGPPELSLVRPGDAHALPHRPHAQTAADVAQEADRQGIPIVVLSALRRPLDPLGGVPVVAAWQKPFEIDQLLDLIKRTLAAR